ncbi:MAG: hypothetical protein FWE80_05130 [Oscillospiraceae bacterium]|nr:hypothetical protein [Oscillospiraceae bacterium]
MEITVSGGEVLAAEQQAYVAYLQNKHHRKLESLAITVDGGEVDLQYVFTVTPFERIRRITGYLVGTLDRWNNAKAAEEHDRVKHSV